MAVSDAPARPDAGLPPRLDSAPAAPTRPTSAPPASSQAGQPGQPGSSAAALPHQSPQAPRPTRPRVSFKAMRVMHGVLARNPLWQSVAGWLASHEKALGAFTAAEKTVKERLFGCRMCGQCALPSTAYACPMTCPKQLRNGPCGGVSFDGSCEVYPGMRCVWLMAYERAEQDDRVSDLRRLQRPIDQRRWGESSWVNYWQGRDENLWTRDDNRASNRIELPIIQPAASR